MESYGVSIFILTYNQEDFISNTLESILIQQANFKYQLVIGEDLSNDYTRQICETYAAKYPEKVKLLPSKERLGLINNFIRTIKECDGKYIAVCDGDDYWIDPFKLQKQYDFLEARPDFSIVYTGIRNLYPSGEFKDKSWSSLNDGRNFNELIFGNFIPSVTAFYRNKQNEENIPDWIGKFPYGDWPIYLWLTRIGDKVGYIDEITGVYRKEIGVSEKMKKIPSDIAKVNLGIVQCVYHDQNFIEERIIVYKSLIEHRFSLMGSYLRELKFHKSFPLAIRLLLINPEKVVRNHLWIFKRMVQKKLNYRH